MLDILQQISRGLFEAQYAQTIIVIELKEERNFVRWFSVYGLYVYGAWVLASVQKMSTSDVSLWRPCKLQDVFHNGTNMYQTKEHECLVVYFKVQSLVGWNVGSGWRGSKQCLQTAYS